MWICHQYFLVLNILLHENPFLFILNYFKFIFPFDCDCMNLFTEITKIN